MATVADIVAQLLLDTADFDDKLASAATRVDNFANHLLGAGAVMTVAFTRPIQSVVGLALSFDDLLFRANTAFTAMLGGAKQAADFMSQLQVFAVTTPFQFEDLIKDTQQLSAMGLESKKILPDLKAIGDQLSIIGRVSPQDIQRVTYAMGEMLTYGKVNQYTLRQMETMGVPAMKYLAEAAGKTTQEMGKLVHEGLVPGEWAVQAIAYEMEVHAPNAMNKMNASLQTGMNNVLDAVKIGLSNLFQPMYTNLAESVQKGSQILLGFSSVIKSWSDDTKLQITSAMISIAAIGPIFLAIGSIAKIIALISTPWGQLSIVIAIATDYLLTHRAVAQQLGNWLVSNFIPILQTVKVALAAYATVMITQAIRSTIAFGISLAVDAYTALGEMGLQIFYTIIYLENLGSAFLAAALQARAFGLAMITSLNLSKISLTLPSLSFNFTAFITAWRGLGAMMITILTQAMQALSILFFGWIRIVVNGLIALQANWSTIWGNIVTFTGKAYTAIDVALTGFFTDLVDGLALLFSTSYWSGIMGRLTLLAQGFLDLGKSAIASIAAMIVALGRLFVTSVVNLVVGIGSSIAATIAWFRSLSIASAASAAVTDTSVVSIATTSGFSFGALISSIGLAITAFIGLAVSAVASAAASVAAWVTAATNIAIGIGVTLVAAISGAIVAIGEFLLPVLAIGAIMYGVSVAWKDDWGHMQEVVHNAVDWIGRDLDTLGDKIKKKISESFDHASQAVKDWISVDLNFLGMTANLGDTITNDITGPFNTASQAVKDFWSLGTNLNPSKMMADAQKQYDLMMKQANFQNPQKPGPFTPLGGNKESLSGLHELQSTFNSTQESILEGIAKMEAPMQQWGKGFVEGSKAQEIEIEILTGKLRGLSPHYQNVLLSEARAYDQLNKYTTLLKSYTKSLEELQRDTSLGANATDLQRTAYEFAHQSLDGLNSSEIQNLRNIQMQILAAQQLKESNEALANIQERLHESQLPDDLKDMIDALGGLTNWAKLGQQMPKLPATPPPVNIPVSYSPTPYNPADLGKHQFVDVEFNRGVDNFGNHVKRFVEAIANQGRTTGLQKRHIWDSTTPSLNDIRPLTPFQPKSQTSSVINPLTIPSIGAPNQIMAPIPSTTITSIQSASTNTQQLTADQEALIRAAGQAGETLWEEAQKNSSGPLTLAQHVAIATYAVTEQNNAVDKYNTLIVSARDSTNSTTTALTAQAIEAMGGVKAWNALGDAIGGLGKIDQSNLISALSVKGVVADLQSLNVDQFKALSDSIQPIKNHAQEAADAIQKLLAPLSQSDRENPQIQALVQQIQSIAAQTDYADAQTKSSEQLAQVQGQLLTQASKLSATNPFQAWKVSQETFNSNLKTMQLPAWLQDDTLAKHAYYLQQELALIQQFSDGLQNTLESAFQNAYTHGIKGFFSTVLADFQKMIYQIASSALSQRITGSVTGLISNLLGITGAAVSTGGGSGDPFSGVNPMSPSGGVTTNFAANGTDWASPGEPWIVGEKGPELIVPKSYSAIHPAGSFGGDTNVHMTIVTPEPDTFRRSNASIINDMYRTVARSRRN